MVKKTIAVYTAASNFYIPRLCGFSLSLSAAQVFIAVAYFCIAGVLIVSVDAPRFSEHFVDDVAFRAAWITLAQVPLVYFLATKRGPLNFLAGISYERINWLHRWVGRVLFISATTHMSIMLYSISIADIIHSKDKVMIIVRYGVGAYGALAWIALTGILPLRRWSYRLFYINHWISTAVFLWILFKHVPRYARLPIYLAAATLAFDRCIFCYTFIKNNTTHVRINMPKLGSLELHPFTPATCSEIFSTPLFLGSDVEQHGLLAHAANRTKNDMILIIKSHSAFTRRLAEYHRQWLSLPCPNSSKPPSALRAFVDGPYGNPPQWEEYEQLTLIATSTGVSFSLAVVDYLEQLCAQSDHRLRTRSIHFIWITRHLDPELDVTVTQMLLRNTEMLRDAGINLTADFFVTCANSSIPTYPDSTQEFDQFAHLRQPRRMLVGKPMLRVWTREMGDEDEGEDEEEQVQTAYSQRSDASSTLIDDEEDRDILSDSEPETPALENPQLPTRTFNLRSCWPRPRSRPIPLPPSCNCRLIQSLTNRSRRATVEGEFVHRTFGSRPDVRMLLDWPSGAEHGRKMVGVCANEGLMTRTGEYVARRNLEYVVGRWGGGWEMWAERGG
ncbi:hypothetical protein EJ04DRAFT_494718 [Polyplosphaeria fusca]|uniref:FAD-binding FR-type domain-containing protein n=1 Tax=Polyplosphaeria fusca TaxID=682080 RepID=A0A9P4QZE9_9PLEO|nr:hypothetical protein EJ04DRAFT_494718 [Polyplosphaeria fusca]